jgi:hypothetical protein
MKKSAASCKKAPASVERHSMAADQRSIETSTTTD